MSNKNSILIIVTIIVLLTGGLIFFFLSSGDKTGTNNQQNNTVDTNLDPFGNTQTNKPTDTNTIGGSQTTTQNKEEKVLSQIYSNPTSGAIFTKNKSNQNVLMFVDRAVGHIYEYILENETGETNRLTNTTVPKIQEAIWSNNGINLILRYLNDDTDIITSFTAKISTGQKVVGVPGEITGSFLTSNIKQLVTNPAGDKIFNIVDKSDKSGTNGFTTNIDGSNKKTVFDSQISHWNISWPKENTVTLTTKPSYRDYGLLYFFNPQTSSFNRILGNITGLSTITNKDASLVAYSYSTNNSFALGVYNVLNKIDENIQLNTLADKCVWGNNDSKILYCAVPQSIINDNYPDAWYQGLQSFTDSIWVVNTETGDYGELYVIGENENAEIDAYDLKISLDDKYLSFSNKKDLSLWLLKIEIPQL